MSNTPKFACDKAITDEITHNYLQQRVLQSLHTLRGQYRQSTTDIVKRTTQNVMSSWSHRNHSKHINSMDSNELSRDGSNVAGKAAQPSHQTIKITSIRKSSSPLILCNSKNIVNEIRGIGGIQISMSHDGRIKAIDVQSLYLPQQPLSTRHSRLDSDESLTMSADMLSYQSQSINQPHNVEVNSSSRGKGSHMYAMYNRDKTNLLSDSLDADRDALTAIFKTCYGFEWKHSTNWGNKDTSLRNWYGVKTDVDGRVVELDLSRNGLRGEYHPIQS